MPIPTLRAVARAAVAIAAALVSLSPGYTDTPTPVTAVAPVDNGKALVNPDMGWVFHYYSDSRREFGWNLAPSDTVDDFSGLSTVYLRIPWAYLEPIEGKFNWAMLDTPAQRWIAKGKKIAIRITSTEATPKYATPTWVKDAGAKGTYYIRNGGAKVSDEANSNEWEPNYDDPVFLDKLDGLVKALGQRYDGNPNVAYVDIGSYGEWGEGHKVVVSGTPDLDAPVYKLHTDLYLKYFKHTLLTINDDTIGPRRQGQHFITTDYARQHGITLRDDSILVDTPPNSYFHSGLAQIFWPNTPVVLEHQPYGASVRSHAWYPDLLLKAVEDYHASYLSIHWWPREELSANRDIIDKINMRLGYRLQPRQIAWPQSVEIGHTFAVSSTWANSGVAPCYPGGYFCLTLKDASGGIVSCLTDDTFDMRNLQPGPPGAAPAIDRSSKFIVGLYAPSTMAGTYDVYVSVGQRDGTPMIALPIDGDDGQHRYKVGTITLTW